MLTRSLSFRPFLSRIEIIPKKFSTGLSCKIEMKEVNIQNAKKKESARMQQFHEKLKADRLPQVGQSLRFVDLVLVDTDPKTGELIPNNEKEPTKWGDWQQGGRVTDF